MRLRLLDVRMSTIPQIVGTIAGDIATVARWTNDAQNRLIFCGGDRGWWGSWYKTVFNLVSQTNPYITCGREIARITDLSVCGVAVPIRNEFYEFLQAGIGLQPTNGCNDLCGAPLETYERGTVSTMVDIPTTGNFILRAYLSDTRDAGKRILISGLDQNSIVIRNVDGVNEVAGEYLTLASPFVDSISQFTGITGVQKDATFRDVSLYAVNTATGAETLLSRYAPDELVPTYRRYYIGNLPIRCCASTSATIQVIGMAKLDVLPVARDTDFLVIGNLPALTEEVSSLWFGRMDNPKLFAMSIAKHRNAIHFLNEEIKHYQGTTTPSIGNPVFGTAKLAYQRIGSLF